jgi:hypothetical protein
LHSDRRRAKLLSEINTAGSRADIWAISESASLRRSYENYEARLEDARTFADMDRQLMADISIIQSAASGEADPPDKRMNMAAGVLIGLVCLGNRVSFASAFLGIRRNSDGTARDSQRLDSLSGADEIWTSD